MDQQIQLGKYRLYHHLATGGMGEVFLARQEGPAGFAKNVVVKRILDGISSDETFVTMFLNEARLAAMIEHPNVVQIFELGLEEGTYFIAMEYIHGRSLRQIRRRLAQLKRGFPPVLAARICSQALQGLHHAHTLTGDDGQPLQIVHRDVSPDNVLIAFNGVTKVVDFGIAKAAINVSTTRAGAVKGKFAYMAPEQITGKPLDGRADVYATGVLLYELLSGQRPFNATTEPGLIKAILEEPPTPLEQANPSIPQALCDVISRALARRPEDRFDTAEQMSLALEAFIQSTGKTITNAHVGAMLRELFPEDAANKTPVSIPTPPPRAVSFGLTPAPSVPRSGISAVGTPGSGPRSGVSARTATPAPVSAVGVPPAPPASVVLARAEAALPEIEILVDDEEKSRPRRGKGAWIAAALGTAAVLGGAAIVLAPRAQSPQPTVAPSEVAAPAASPAQPDARPPEARPVKFSDAAEAPATVEHEPEAEARPEPPLLAEVTEARPTRRPRPVSRRPEKPAAPVVARAETEAPREPEPEAPKTGMVIVRVNPWAEVFFAGRSMGVTPMDAVELPAGKQVLMLRNPDLSLERKISVNVVPGGQIVVKADLLE